MISVTVRFGNVERSNGEITASWIEEQVRVREHDGGPVCAAVSIDGDGVDVALAAGDCPPRRGSRITYRHPALFRLRPRASLASSSAGLGSESRASSFPPSPVAARYGARSRAALPTTPP
jgi:hypothetical protein